MTTLNSVSGRVGSSEIAIVTFTKKVAHSKKWVTVGFLQKSEKIPRKPKSEENRKKTDFSSYISPGQRTILGNVYA